MGNLGLYQTMTTISKKVGGPKPFLVMVGCCGYAVIRIAEWGVKVVVKEISKQRNKETSQKAFCVHTAGKSNEGLEFKIGDEFRVLERDKDAVLIEKIGEENNPFFVSCALLNAISDYK